MTGTVITFGKYNLPKSARKRSLPGGVSQLFRAATPSVLMVPALWHLSSRLLGSQNSNLSPSCSQIRVPTVISVSSFRFFQPFNIC